MKKDREHLLVLRLELHEHHVLLVLLVPLLKLRVENQVHVRDPDHQRNRGLDRVHHQRLVHNAPCHDLNVLSPDLNVPSLDPNVLLPDLNVLSLDPSVLLLDPNVLCLAPSRGPHQKHARLPDPDHDPHRNPAQ